MLSYHFHADLQFLTDLGAVYMAMWMDGDVIRIKDFHGNRRAAYRFLRAYLDTLPGGPEPPHPEFPERNPIPER